MGRSEASEGGHDIAWSYVRSPVSVAVVTDGGELKITCQTWNGWAVDGDGAPPAALAKLFACPLYVAPPPAPAAPANAEAPRGILEIQPSSNDRDNCKLTHISYPQASLLTMADASCSGATPFKRLTDHQSRDVSHHQDRLVNGAGAQSQGSFRSIQQQPGQAQDGFGAFMDGPSALPGMAHYHHAAGRLQAHAAALDPSHAHAPSFAASQTPHFQNRATPAPDVSNWAADFSRFSSQQQPRQPLQQGLQQGFHQPGAQMHMAQPSSQLAFQSAFAQPAGTFSPLYGPTNGGFMDPAAASAQRPAAEAEFDQEMNRWMASHGNSNGQGMEDVDAVMDQMARELELNDAALVAAESTAQEAAIAESNQDQSSQQIPGPDVQALDVGMVGMRLSLPNDIAGTTQVDAEQLDTEQIDGPKSKSEVSEAAERLLESVQHEGGDKWKNSVFLSLMRDFRDGKKDIVDNEIRETPEHETDSAEPLN
ncbi:hypothetical protein G7046_g2614 [Stylonectria norvegica]|nr:hypothetical protein G7046_g2614 [Stylonectria norvegica]